MNKVILPIVIIMIGLFLIFQEKENKEVIDTINVDIKGAVKYPGKYVMSYQSCVDDLIKEAGGLRFDASTRYINLAKKLEDEMVVVIYTDAEINDLDNDLVVTYCNCPEVSNDTCVVSEENNKEKININLASLEELMTLSGIGETKAKAIIDYRTTNGSFTKLEDIMNVKGIGEATYNKIKDFITI